MPSHTPQPLTTSLLLSILTLPFLVPFTAIILFVRHYYHYSTIAHWPVKRIALLSFANAFISHAPPLFLRWLLPPNGHTIRKLAHSLNLPLARTDLTPGPGIPPATLWTLTIPPPPAPTPPPTLTLLYIAGCAFTEPLVDTNGIAFLARLAPQAHIARLALLEHTLAPEAPYPHPLAQLAAATAHLLRSGTPAASTILAGDSSGANLALALLQHARAPHPDIPALPLPAGAQFRAALAVSPWVNFDSVAPSMQAPHGLDTVRRAALRRSRAAYAPKIEAWADPGQGAWEGTPVGEVLVTWGEWEMMRDDCASVGRALQEGLGRERVRCVEGVKEVHCGFLVQGLEGRIGEVGTGKAIAEWLCGLA